MCSQQRWARSSREPWNTTISIAQKRDELVHRLTITPPILLVGSDHLELRQVAIAVLGQLQVRPRPRELALNDDELILPGVRLEMDVLHVLS